MGFVQVANRLSQYCEKTQKRGDEWVGGHSPSYLPSPRVPLKLKPA